MAMQAIRYVDDQHTTKLARHINSDSKSTACLGMQLRDSNIMQEWISRPKPT